MKIFSYVFCRNKLVSHKKVSKVALQTSFLCIHVFQNSISWEYYKRNNAILFLQQIFILVSKVFILAVYPSRSTHINQFITHTRKLVASIRKMKHLKSNLVGGNVAILPVGKQHNIAYEISERVG